MARKKKESEQKSGLVSSAGLMRYYDTEESTTVISPKAIVALSIGIAVMAITLNVFYLWL